MFSSRGIGTGATAASMTNLEFISSGPLTPCADCGDQGSEDAGYGDLSYWLTDDAFWAAIGGDDTITLCPRCFGHRANRKGYGVEWRAIAIPAPRRPVR